MIQPEASGPFISSIYFIGPKIAALIFGIIFIFAFTVSVTYFAIYSDDNISALLLTACLVWTFVCTLILNPMAVCLKIEGQSVHMMRWLWWEKMDLDSVVIVEYPAHRYPEESGTWKQPMLILNDYNRRPLEKLYVSAMFEQDRKVVDAFIDILHARERDRIKEKAKGE